MWREPAAIRALPRWRRSRLRLGGRPRTDDEAAALAAYVEWLTGPMLLLRPALIGFGVLLGGLLSPSSHLALGMAAVAFLAAVGLELAIWQLARKQVGDHAEALPARPVAAAALAIVVVTVGLGVWAFWLTQQVTILVVGDDLLQVVNDVDDQWWGRAHTVVVPGTEQVPAALEQETPDILLLTNAAEPVGEGVGPGHVVGARQDDPSVVVTLHLTNGEGPTAAFMQELLTWPGPGPDAFRRAGFTDGP